MTFKNWSLALVALMLVAPLSASALGVNIVNVSSTGASTVLLDGGDIITFDLVVENSGYEDIYGLGVGVWGYDDGLQGSSFDNRLVFQGGSASDQMFSLDAGGGVYVDGINNLVPVNQQGSGPPLNFTQNVQLFRGAELSGRTRDTLDDLGVDGSSIGSGDVHMRVSFLAQELASAGDLTLTFGTGEYGNAAIGDGGATLGFANASWTMTVVPEPGTALLMGLGLAGLAGSRRR